MAYPFSLIFQVRESPLKDFLYFPIKVSFLVKTYTTFVPNLQRLGHACRSVNKLPLFILDISATNIYWTGLSRMYNLNFRNFEI